MPLEQEKIDTSWRVCAEIASSGEYHFQRAVMGKSHEHASILAQRAYDKYVPFFAKSVTQRLLGMRQNHAV